MAKKRTFISFDYDNDVDLKNALVGQSRLSDSPFDITDISIKEAIYSNWKENARRRIKGCEVVVVICGQYTGIGVFTIVEVREGKGSDKSWGKLKSGAGWISLDY